MIAIVDYGVGNIKAFSNIYKRLNVDYLIARESSDLKKAKKIILPGVGSFDHAMERLHRSGMKDELDTLVLSEKIPVLGICVGMQMLARQSEEGTLPGLGWVDATVNKFDRTTIGEDVPLPHMGWNSISIHGENSLTKRLDTGARFYFLHSYYFSCRDELIVASASYGKKFACIINSENIYGIQCHPEKSHQDGIRLLENFGAL